MPARESQKPYDAGQSAVIHTAAGQPVVIQVQPPRSRRWGTRLLLLALAVSVIVNFVMYFSYEDYFSGAEGPREVFHSGEAVATAKIARIEAIGTISPPFTGRIRKAIQRATEDEDVKGVLLVIDSPGGLVADSHQIYHDLVKLREKKPVYVAMQRLAASGGYYIAMGAGTEGKIYAEPTTWTGSIGVIIPRFDLTGLAEEYGVKSDSLKTGPFKDALNPFRTMGEEERQVWEAIMDDAFQRFLTVIADNRAALDIDATRALATGQVYTAEQAKQKGLIDALGYEEDALEDLKARLELKSVRVVTYDFPFELIDLVMGGQAKEDSPWEALMDASVPRAWYFCSWAPYVSE